MMGTKNSELFGEKVGNEGLGHIITGVEAVNLVNRFTQGRKEGFLVANYVWEGDEVSGNWSKEGKVVSVGDLVVNANEADDMASVTWNTVGADGAGQDTIVVGKGCLYRLDNNDHGARVLDLVIDGGKNRMRFVAPKLEEV